MDNFKKYIQENADKLDCEAPSEKVMDTLYTLAYEKNKNIFHKLIHNYYARVACVIGLLGLITIVLVRFNKEKTLQKEASFVPNTQKQEMHTAETLISKNAQPETRTQAETREKRVTDENSSSTKKKESEAANKDREGAAPDEIHPKLRYFEEDIDPVIDHYINVVNTTPLLAESPAYYDYFIQEFTRIDQAKSVIEEAMRKQGESDILFYRLVNINQQKLKVLKDLEKEILKTNSFYKDRNNTDEVEPLCIKL